MTKSGDARSLGAPPALASLAGSDGLSAATRCGGRSAIASLVGGIGFSTPLALKQPPQTRYCAKRPPDTEQRANGLAPMYPRGLSGRHRLSSSPPHSEKRANGLAPMYSRGLSGRNRMSGRPPHTEQRSNGLAPMYPHGLRGRNGIPGQLPHSRHRTADRLIRVLRRDQGGVLVLGIGVLGLLLAFTAIVVDLGHLAHRHLAVTAAVERVALAGAMAVDSSVEATSAKPGTRLRLARRAAAVAARAAAAAEAAQWPGLRIAALDVRADFVQARLCAPVVLPLAWHSVGRRGSPVCATAAAATAVSWAQYP